MTTYTLSRTSPTNTILTDSEGAIVYEVRTPFNVTKRETTITRRGQVVAVIRWKVFARSTVTMGGQTRFVKEVFPKTKFLSTSRIYTTNDGQQIKWKSRRKLYCALVDSGHNLATYYRNRWYLFSNKKSTLDITSTGLPLTDILIVTWVIAEKKARDRRRARYSRGGSAGP